MVFSNGHCIWLIIPSCFEYLWYKCAGRWLESGLRDGTNFIMSKISIDVNSIWLICKKKIYWNTFYIGRNITFFYFSMNICEKKYKYVFLIIFTKIQMFPLALSGQLTIVHNNFIIHVNFIVYLNRSFQQNGFIYQKNFFLLVYVLSLRL